MAQGRIVLRTLGSSRKFAALAGICRQMPEFAQLLFPLLVANSDEYGRLSGDAFTVKHAVFPTSPRPADDFEIALSALAEAGLILRYTVEGECYIQIVKFEQGQPGLRLDRRRKRSCFPAPPKDSGKPHVRRQVPDDAGNCRKTPPKRREEKRREEKKDPVDADAPTGLGHQDLVDHYFERFTAAVGSPPKFNQADGRVLKTLIQSRGAGDVLAVMDAMFDSSDDFVRRSGYGIGFLSSQYNKLLVGMRRREAAAARRLGPARDTSAWTCEHDPACGCRQQHQERLEIEAMKGRLPTPVETA